MSTSLRLRLNFWLSMSILVAGTGAAALSFVLSFNDANDMQDAQLEQVAALLHASTDITSRTSYVPHTEEGEEVHFIISDLNPATRGSIADAIPLTPDMPPGLQSVERNGMRWRVNVSENVAGQRFAVSQSMTVRDEFARDAAFFTLMPQLLLIPALLLIVNFTVKRTFAPLDALSAELDRLDGGQPVPLAQQFAPREVLPLLQAVNRLTQRLALALGQQRRLVSDAAHELRTPVAALIVQADNVLHVELPPEARARMDTLRQGLARMAALLDQLLKLALVQGLAPSSPQRLDLAKVVRNAIEEILPLAQAKGVDLGCVRIEAAQVVGDPTHAHALVRNVIDNAVRYTPAGGAVDVSVTLEHGDAVIAVEDGGPGIATADLERVFQPFVRILGSGESGSGLGLSIVRTASEVLGGTVTLGPRADGMPGLRVTYRQHSA